MPHLVEMQEKFRKEGLVVVTVNFDADDPPEPKEKYTKAATEILRKNKVTTLNVHLDEKVEDIATHLRIIAAPTVYLFDRQGRWSAFGGVDIKGAPDLSDKKRLDNLVEQLIKEAPGK